MTRRIGFEFDGDERDAVRAFDNVGDSARRMASRTDDTSTSFNRLGERADTMDTRMMGLSNLMTGFSDVTGNALPPQAAFIMGLSDIGAGIYNFAAPALGALTGMFPKLAGAMTFISAHPLVLGILAGGAIIAGLVLLEKKFGIVSGAVGAMGDAFRMAWDNGIRPALNFMIGGIELYLRAMAMPFTLLNKIPGVGNLVPDGIANIRLPRLDVGGTILQSGLAVVHKGEQVRPAQVAPLPAGGGGDTHVYLSVAGSVVSADDLIDTIEAGLARKKNRNGRLDFEAA